MKRYLFPFCLLIGFCAGAQVTFTSSNLPVIVLNTNGATIPDDPKIPAVMGIINNAPGLRNNITDPFNEYNGNIGIEVRGQTSQSFPQVSYSIELRDSTGINDNDQPLLGLPKESDWVLYAPYDDKTLMRNFLAYTISNSLGHWASHSRFAELILNNQYMGIYVLEEKIKRDSGRVNIKKLEPADSAGNALTGGYIFSIDKQANGWYSNYQPPATFGKYIQFSYIYPKLADITFVQQAYIQRYVDSFENALAAPSFQDTANGFRKFADENSFIDYFIINEVSRNVDAYRLSTYLYKNRNSVNRKIMAGPVWDYNIAFRNADYCDGSNYQSWAYQFNYVCPTDYNQIPFWWNRFMQDTAFKAHLSCRWRAQRQGVLSVANINHWIDSIALLVNEAQQRHFTRWPILGQYTWPNPQPIPTTYGGEISSLKAWIASRLAWMDVNMPYTGSCLYLLPITLKDFSAVRKDNDAVLWWHTISEQNSSHFVVERSTDGRHFTTIGKVNAAGNSTRPAAYGYMDKAIDQLKVAKVYYRLQLVDKDGTSKASDVQSVNVMTSLQLHIFPNPVVNNLNLDITCDSRQSIEIIIINARGQQLISGSKVLTAGINRVAYNTATWPKGTYLVKVMTEKGNYETQQVVK